MILPKLDSKLEKSLIDIDIQNEDNYALSHEIFWYGADAVIHSYLFQKAQEIITGEISLTDFIEKQELHNFVGERELISERKNFNGFYGSLKPIREEGIFLPAAISHSSEEHIFRYFASDYHNRFGFGRDNVDRKLGVEMIERSWTRDDLMNPEIIAKGLRFTQEMWKTCVEGFEWYLENSNSVQPEQITVLGRELIGYYTHIIK
jgi:hypothetical protein